MLSVFPNLFTYALAVPLVFRLLVGFTFLRLGFAKLTSDRKRAAEKFERFGLRPGIFYLWLAGVLEIGGGLALIAGFLTQAAALLVSLITLALIFAKLRQPDAIPASLGFLCLLFVISSSLLFLGPGFYAFDWPL